MFKSVQFSIAKNGEETCSCDGRFLHSKYNPSSESQKFVQNLQADFSPKCVFIIEPCLSYCEKFLRERFSNTELYAIRFSNEFSKKDNSWDKVFYFSENLSDELFEYLGEEKLCSSLFFEWTTARTIFSEETEETWKAIKNAVVKSRDVMVTRAYFSKRWLKNSVIFASRIRNTTTMNHLGKKNVLIVASGPSLESSIEKIKQNRNKFFLIAVSSAYKPLFENEITPDVVMSTDGGFWAKFHLDYPERKGNTIFALSTESAIPSKILKNEKIIPLIYDDVLPFQKRIIEKCGIKSMIARRNGTVSGTALEFAKSITNGNVFLCGLDQAPAKGFQHTQPNALEVNSSKNDGRLSSTETRIMSSRFNSEKSLEIYRNWFISNSVQFSKSVFRLSNNFKYDFGLGEIKDINWNDFEKISNNSIQIDCFSTTPISKVEKNRIIKEEIEKAIEEKDFEREYFPAISLVLEREKDEEKKFALKTKLDEEKQDLLKGILSFL